MDKHNWPSEYPDPQKYKDKNTVRHLIVVGSLVVGLLVICSATMKLAQRLIAGIPGGITIHIEAQATSSPVTDLDATLVPIDINTHPEQTTPMSIPEVYATLNVNEYSTFTVYRKQDLWESAVGVSIVTEDFEGDIADYGALSYPYLTGNGFLLEGQSSAQILQDETLLGSGNLLHFRDWGDGLKFGFPNDVRVRAFGFDYRASERWHLILHNSGIALPEGRPGFMGIVIHQDYPGEFILSSTESSQGGLSVDNISYVSTNLP